MNKTVLLSSQKSKYDSLNSTRAIGESRLQAIVERFQKRRREGRQLAVTIPWKHFDTKILSPLFYMFESRVVLRDKSLSRLLFALTGKRELSDKSIDYVDVVFDGSVRNEYYRRAR